jgi:S-DNA-T family DNA segregation ATPase FtsK/SpoIIIE
LQVELPLSTGGILGQEVGDTLLIMLGNSGATLLFLAIFLAGITLFTGLSWFALLDFVGRYTLLASNELYQRTLSIYDVYRDQRIQSKIRVREERVINKKPLSAEKVKITPTLSTIELSDREYKESQADLFEPDVLGAGEQDEALFKGKLPTLSLLDKRRIAVQGYSSAELEEMSRQVEAVLLDFNVVVEVVGVLPGPVITRFELQLAAGIKVSRVSGLSKDIARGLSVISVRIVEVIQGKSVIGLEIPNQEREMVSFRDLIASNNFEKSKSKLTFAMGKDISGMPVVADLGKMPHVLVAGTTGSGKSVAINTMILSLLYKSTPEEVRMIMIDPKMLELSVYEGIPHLLTPVVTDMKDAQNALRWAVAEMERRYKLMSKLGVRNLAGYNQKITDAEKAGEPIRDPLFKLIDPLQEGEEFPVLDTLPSIVIVIDELADMMMIVGKKVEELIARLAQKARAAGIHLVLATQRPSVDVLTGLIKANVPTRISFQVSSRIDSRTILDQGGAEALLGNGDMLFLPSGTSIPIRAHGAFVDDHEVHKIVDFLKKTAPANYLSEITQERSDASDSVADGGGDSEMDVLYDEAVQFVTESRKASISSVQRRFKVGYNRAARMIEDMEAAGVVSMAEGNGSRQVLAPPAPKD